MTTIYSTPTTITVTSGGTSSTGAAQDWLARISGPGVVWYHDFTTAAEVNQFRSTNGYGGGDDPLGLGTSSPRVEHDTTDGVATAGCLRLRYVNGQSSYDSCWWRPFSPLKAGNNGRSTDDPGANGTLTPLAWNFVDRGSQLQNWNRGWYANPSAPMYGRTRDGNQFFIQMRVKMDPRRTISTANRVGKLNYISIAEGRISLSAQEIVTYSGGHEVANGPNFFRMYSRNFSPVENWDSVGRPGQQLGKDGSNYSGGPFCHVRNESGGSANFCWAWSGGWDTILYHITPGYGGLQNQRIVVYAARQGETSYTKIWDETYAVYHSADKPEGYQALICSIYQNGASYPSEFWHKFDQIIFSTQMIPCPQV